MVRTLLSTPSLLQQATRMPSWMLCKHQCHCESFGPDLLSLSPDWPWLKLALAQTDIR